MPDAKLIGRIIHEYRESRGLLQELASGLAGICRTHLSAIECGRRKPTPETFFKLCEAINVKPSDVMKRIEDALGGRN